MAKILLLIEDDKVLSNMYEKLLSNHRYTIETIDNGEDGLKVALRDRPALILLDIGLPKMDGMTLMHSLRQDAWGKNVPIIILTNYDTNDEMLAGVLQDQPAYYLIKSNNPPETVVEKIKEILEPKKPPTS